MTFLRNWLGRWLCSYEIHDCGTRREGVCVRCGAWVASDQ